MYRTDVLEILDILTGLGIADNRMDDAMGIVRQRDDMGRWKAENAYNSDRLLIPMDREGERQMDYPEGHEGIEVSFIFVEQQQRKIRKRFHGFRRYGRGQRLLIMPFDIRTRRTPCIRKTLQINLLKSQQASPLPSAPSRTPR